MCILTLCLFVSCESVTPAVITDSPTDLMAKIVSVFPDIPVTGAVYFEGAEELEPGYLDSEYACYIYTRDYIEGFDMLDKLEAYAIRIPDTKSAFEIHILKVRNLSDTETIADYCESRINLLKSGDIAEYDSEMYSVIIEKAHVYTVGNYVFLLSTPDNDAVKDIIHGR